MPMARPSSITRVPMAPVPKTPSVLPRSWPSISRGHLPSRTWASICGIFRATASMRASVCSATAMAFAPGVLHTVTPRRPAASRSMLSVPVPHTDTSARFLHAMNTPSVKRAWARMLTAMRARSTRRMSSASEYTRVSPIARQRCSASLPANTDGKSSGTTMRGSATGGTASRRRRRRSGPRPPPPPVRAWRRDRAAPAPGRRAWGARTSGSPSCPWCRCGWYSCGACPARCR